MAFGRNFAGKDKQYHSLTHYSAQDGTGAFYVQHIAIRDGSNKPVCIGLTYHADFNTAMKFVNNKQKELEQK